MAKRTKKVGPAGRFQARYGVRARSRLRNVELQQRKRHLCPSCKHTAVKRISTAIYQCGKCGVKFAGGSYIPKTDSGLFVDKIIRGERLAAQKENESEEPKSDEK
jgi:large subunit ribosomal protein L37Ae